MQGAARKLFALLACAGCLAWPMAARAQSASDDLARRHFDSGTAYLEESDYENALQAFEKAHELSKRPAILLNIATVQERRGDLRAAITALEGYLQAEPEGEHAETTRLRIQNLAKRAEAEAAPPPPAPAPPPPPPPPAAAAPAPAPAPRRDSGASHLPAYIAFGAGGLGAVTALVTGILANSKYQSAKDECSPKCTDDEVSSGRTLAWVSTAATGVAILGAGLGVTLLLTSSGGSTAATAPALRVGFGPSGPRAEAAVRF
ncbi:MAG TPA: tetratricopeptide repeat protein [Polyangiaceae bacterium]